MLGEIFSWGWNLVLIHFSLSFAEPGDIWSPPRQKYLCRELGDRSDELIQDFSMKGGTNQYRNRITHATRFLVDKCGYTEEDIWPLSITPARDFICYLQSLSRCQSTISGYMDAFAWWHDVNRWTRLKELPGAQYLKRLLDAVFRANLSAPRSRDEMTPAMLDVFVEKCLERSTSVGDCWFRTATIFALQYGGRARISEILLAYNDRIRWVDGDVEILLEYEDAKTIALTAGRRASTRSKAVQWVRIPRQDSPRNGACLLRRWWIARDLGRGGVPLPVFGNPQTGRPIVYSTVRRQMIVILIDMGLDPTLFCTHSMRIGGASEDLRQGMPLPEIRETLRHAPESVSTFRYLPPGTQKRLRVQSKKRKVWKKGKVDCVHLEGS